MTSVLLADIGGTSIQTAITRDYKSLETVSSVRLNEFSSPVDWIKSVRNQYSTDTFDRWIIGVPSPITSNGDIAETPNLTEGWEGRSILESLKSQECDFILENDANLAALGESTFGAGEEYTNFVCVTLGSGIGSGIIINNELFRGTSGAGGEIGHITLEPDGRPCNCGDRGCFEVYASANGLERTYRLETPEFPDHLSAKDIMARMDEDDDAYHAIKRTAQYLGQGLSTVSNILEPELFVFSGGLSESFDVLREWMKPAFESHVFAQRTEQTPFLKAEKEHPALWGGIALARELLSS